MEKIYPDAFILTNKLIETFRGTFMNAYYERKYSHFLYKETPINMIVLFVAEKGFIRITIGVNCV